MSDDAPNTFHGTKKRGRKVINGSPIENLGDDAGLKAAALNVNDSLQTSSNNSGSAIGSASTLSQSSPEDWKEPAYLELQSSFDAPVVPFPSLDSKKASSSSSTKRQKKVEVVAAPPLHSMSTSSSLLTIALQAAPLEPKTKQPIGRPRKITVEPPPPKRPVGRPRIHPVKSTIVDPNKPKRGEYTWSAY